MNLKDFDYLMTLIDTSQNKTVNNLYIGDFAHHQLLLVDKPGYAISQEARETQFSAGDVIYAAPGRRFGIRCDGEMNVRYIAFTGRNIRPLMHYCHFGEFRVTRLTSSNDVSNLFSKISDLHASESVINHVDLSEALYSLIAFLGAANIENDNYIFDAKSLMLRPVIDYMQENYRKPSVSYKELILSLAITMEELDSAFFDAFCMSTDQFYKQLRMKNAKHLLFFYHELGTDYVAENMGYTDGSKFRMDFYEQFNITPEAFVGLYFNK